MQCTIDKIIAENFFRARMAARLVDELVVLPDLPAKIIRLCLVPSSWSLSQRLPFTTATFQDRVDRSSVLSAVAAKLRDPLLAGRTRLDLS